MLIQSEMKISFKRTVLFLIVTGCAGSFAYIYPRFLAVQLGENSPWISYLYTYGMGFIVFSSSLLLIFTRKIDPLRRKQELYWLTAIMVGFFFMFFCHGLWIYLAVHFPVKF